MNAQQEYDIFMVKFAKSLGDIKNEFNRLSFDNQQRFVNEANTLLRSYGYAITVEDLMRNNWWSR